MGKKQKKPLAKKKYRNKDVETFRQYATLIAEVAVYPECQKIVATGGKVSIDDAQNGFEETIYAEHITYPTLGLVGEAGEFADKVKKIMRDEAYVISGEVRESLILELGDLMFYVARAARHLNISLSDVALRNIQKLQGRVNRGTLNGAGDHR